MSCSDLCFTGVGPVWPVWPVFYLCGTCVTCVYTTESAKFSSNFSRIKAEKKNHEPAKKIERVILISWLRYANLSYSAL